MKRFCLISLYILISLFCMVLHAATPSVKIISDAVDNKIEVNETFHITIRATDCAGKEDVKQMPPGVKVVYHTTNKSSNHSFVNGHYDSSSTTSLIMTCKGRTPGTYTYGPVTIDGRKSNKITYQVVEPSQGRGTKAQPSSGSQNYDPNGGPLFVGNGNEEMFLVAHVNHTTAYEQQAIEYTVKLYTSYGDIKFLGASAAPKFDGFVVEESNDISKSFVFEDYKGKSYKTAIIARYIIFPQKSGKLKIKGNTYTVSTDAKQYFQDPYYQNLTVKRPIQLDVTPNDITIEVKELPSPIPENFIGGVGKFSIESSISSKNLSTNTAGSIKYRIKGSGNIKYLKMPELQSVFPSSIEVYSPKVTTDATVGKSTVSGQTVFDYSILPRETGSFTLPALTLYYFDPEEEEYKTLQTEKFDISVAMGSSSSKSQQALAFNPELMPAGKLSPKLQNPYVESFTYWLWYIVPLFLFFLSLGIYRKYLRDHEDLTLLRSKQANKMALKRLAKAYQCFQNHQDEQFYDEMLAALWGYIGDKLKMPTSELNRQNVSEEFKSHGVKESTFMPILNLIDECEYAKYTPVSREANMRQLYADALESLSKVESEYEEETAGAQNVREDSDGGAENYVNTMSPADNNKSDINTSENKDADS